MKNFFKLIIAVLLLPTLFFVLVEVMRILAAALGDFKPALSFILGALIYCGIHFGYYRFSRLYVFGHEVTHALAALLFGYRIKDMSVKENSGYVKMTRYNTVVVLAPYFVPLYTLAIAFIYLTADLFTDMTPYRFVFVFLVGFFTAFHFVQTFQTLFEANQPDLKMAGGSVFSVITITFVNLVILALVLKGLFPDAVALLPGAKNVLVSTVNLWRILVNYIVERIINAA